MKISKFTFGKSPAAVYLADHLNNINKPRVNQRVGRIMTSVQSKLSELEQANIDGSISAHTLADVLRLMRSGFYVDVGDDFASKLTTNILIGNMKSLLRRAQSVRLVERQMKKTKEVEYYIPVPDLIDASICNFTPKKTGTGFTIADFCDTITPETLTDKQRAKGKWNPDTIVVNNAMSSGWDVTFKD